MDNDIELPLLNRKDPNFHSKVTADSKDSSNHSLFSECLNPDPSQKFRKISSRLRCLAFTDVIPISKQINQSQEPISLSGFACSL